MTTKRRLDQVDEALMPREVVLQWLVEAQTYPTFGAYVGFLLDQPKSSYPSVRLPLRVAESMQDALRGHSPEYRARQAAMPMLATAFLVLLVGVINTAVEETLRIEGLRSLALTWWHRSLRLEDRADDEATGSGGYADWRQAVAVHRREVGRVEAARRAADERHYGGRSCLFPELDADWSRLHDGIDRHSEAVHDPAEVDPDDCLSVWELQTWTELLRNLGLHTATMSLTDHQVRQSLQQGS
jgi:hypothetical protein